MAIGRRKTTTSPKGGSFELNRLEWTAPDRIEVSGTFTALGSLHEDPPVLVVDGGDAKQRLSALPQSISGPVEDGNPWRAEFTWDTAPFPFESAALEFADGSSVALDSAATDVEEPAQAAEPLAGSAADQPHADAELLAAHAAARQGLEAVQRAAEAAVAEQREVADRLGTDLRHATETLEARDAEIASLRARIEELEPAAERARAESERLSSRLALVREALDDRP